MVGAVKTLLDMNNEEFKRINEVTRIKYSDESLKWFHNKIKSQKGWSQHKVLNEVGDSLHSFGGMIGKMVFFQYKAEGAADLPYWDAFPLTIFFNESKTHLWGINFHYMPPEIRLIIFREMMKIIGASHVNDKRKIVLQWQLLKSMTQNKYIKHAVKCYLKKNVNGIPVVVRPSEWHQSIMLPVENFQKAGKQHVWRMA